MKPRHMALGAALLGAVLLAVFGDKAPDSEVAEAVERVPAARPLPPAAMPTVRTAAPPAAPPAADSGAAGPVILALVPRDTLVGDGDGDARFRDGESGVFGRQDWTPPPPPAPPAPPPPPPPPPSAPPLPFTVIGKSVADGVWEVYLARGDRTYVVRDKALIDGTYRVDAIAPPLLTLTYLPLNIVQQLNIGVFE